MLDTDKPPRAKPECSSESLPVKSMTGGITPGAAMGAATGAATGTAESEGTMFGLLTRGGTPGSKTVILALRVL